MPFLPGSYMLSQMAIQVGLDWGQVGLVMNSQWGSCSGSHAMVGLVLVRWNHGATHVYTCPCKWVVGRVWWHAMRCNRGHSLVGTLGSQAQNVRGVPQESWRTAGRSWGIIRVFVCATFPVVDDAGEGLASFGASSRGSGGTLPVASFLSACRVSPLALGVGVVL